MEKNDSMNDLITVIIPIYNVENCLQRCVDAVCNQSYRNLQIILVDDGSTDQSGSICDAYAKKDSRILVIHKKNGGTSSARNTGLENAKGDYVGFLDSDDWPELDLYETLVKGLHTNPGAVVAQAMSRDYAVDGTLLKGPQRDDLKTVLLSQKDYYQELMLHTGDSSFCTKLFAADFIKPYRFKEHQLNEDFELLLRMLPRLSGIVTIGKVGYNIELRTGSNTRGKYNQALYEAMMANAKTAVTMAEELFPEELVYAKRFELVQALDFMLHVPIEVMKSDNAFYSKMKKLLKDSGQEIKLNPYLDDKQRRNLKRLRPAPVLVRKVHRCMMRLRRK